MRLIDADALAKVKFHGYPEIEITPSDVNAEAYKRGWNDAIDAIIESAPTIDAVKHGRWIAQKGGGYCCSECGRYSLDEVDGAFIHVSARTRYCHNCGTRMEKEE
jgi:hypothetical protein